MTPSALLRDADGVDRCWWCGVDPLYVSYHDDEWGRPQHDDHRLFEKICLEGFQAGLSWITILRKRENFRRAFAGFDPELVSRFEKRDITRLLGDAGIVRHRGKIESTINNAARALDMIEAHGSMRGFLAAFVPEAAPVMVDRDMMPAVSDDSKRLSRELKRLGWSFVGPTTMYAFMQSVGMVNDHIDGCHVREDSGGW